MDSTYLRRVFVCWTIAVGMASTHCGNTTVPNKFQGFHIVSTVPAVQGGNGEYTPVCSGEQAPDAVLMQMSLMGTLATHVGQHDRDLSIRPGDRIRQASNLSTGKTITAAEGDTIGNQHFVRDIQCMEPYSYNNSNSPTTCAGMELPTGSSPSWLGFQSDFAPDSDGFYSRTFMDRDKMGVAILIDQSGSMKGFVDKNTYKEVEFREGEILWSIPTWEPDGSDPKGQHIAAVEHFLNELNVYEKSIVFQFGGQTGHKPQPVCWNPDGLEGFDLYEHCYSTDRGLVLQDHPDFNHATAELAKLVNGGQGRTPLWQAVSDVYDFMTFAPHTESRHIVVIGDGPDTCHIDSPDFLPVVRKSLPNDDFEYVYQPQCSSTGFEEVRARVLADRADNIVPNVHIHFVQFQAPGYPDRDPRQQELACVTGGHYIFVNSEDIPKGDKDAPPEEANPITGKYLYPALQKAIMKIRYALAGSWAMAVDLPGLSSMQKGSEIALKGSITLQAVHQGCSSPPCGLTAFDITTHLGFGLTGTAYDQELALVDLRPVFRLPCAAPSDCDWYPDQSSECATPTCVDGDGLCGVAPVEDGTDCSQGICCAGQCFEDANTCTGS